MKLRLLFILILIFIAQAACNKKPPTSDKLHLALTITPLAFFVENIGGTQVEYTIMLPQGSDPHHYEPAPAALARFTGSSAIVKSGGPGLDFELNLLPKISKLAGQIKIINAGAGIDPLADDPHLWLSFSSGVTIANNLTRELCLLDAEHCELYQERNRALIVKIERAARSAALSLQGRKTDHFLVFHPAWAYLAREFDLRQIAVEAGGKEPGPALLAQVIDRARSNGVTAIFVSPQFSKKSAETVAREIGINLISIGPLEQDWLNNLQKAVSMLSESLKK
jgi:zinc transport system substrate-binding protein